MNVNYANQMTSGLKAGILLSIVVVSILIARSSFIILHPEMASAITFDLTITLPIGYWFFIRKTKISKLSVFGVFTFGIIVASFILPENNRRLLGYLKFFALPVFELGVLSYAGFLVYKSRQTYKLFGQDSGDFLENLRQTLVKELSSEWMAKTLTFEIAAFYYAVFSWKAKRGENFFTYHRKNGAAALMSVLGFTFVVETIILHILIANWNTKTAWILTVFSSYFLFQIYAHGKAVFLRPIEIIDDKIFIRCGLLGDAQIDLKNVESIEFAAPSRKVKKDEVKLSPLGKFTVCNTKLTLREKAILNGIYGKRKIFKTIFLSIDESAKFKAEIENNLTNKK